jgi:hypothetical protein
VKAVAHALHCGHGVPVRRLPAILREMTGIELTQSALTQDALKQVKGAVGKAYQRLRGQVRQAPVVYTDDTLPAVFLRAADRGKRFWEFFTANIRNRNTRRAYFVAVARFCA